VPTLVGGWGKCGDKIAGTGGAWGKPTKWDGDRGCENIYFTASLSLSLSLSLSVLTAIFQVNLGLPVLLELRTMEVVVTTGAQDVRSSSQTVTTNKPMPRFIQARCPSCHQSTVSKH